ncbi:MAG: FG-GAP repeat protein, partial [Candidatus Thermoplasmatota archaeon]|nr:FG-GAP repeat protein [Candidatus Thermoplasmatota archaeon]
MHLSRRILNLLVVVLMTSAPVVFIFTGQLDGCPEKDTPPSRANPWNQLVPGTKIMLAPGKVSNTSYYYPVPIGSTVLSANFSFSNIPYTQGGTDFSRDAWLNIGGDSKEYVYGIAGEGIFGSWGLQNRTAGGETVIEQDVTETTMINGRFVLPKNATLTSATMDITGYQRNVEWKNDNFAGTARGEMVGFEVRDIDGKYVGVGDPGFSSSSGRVFLVYGNRDAPLSTTLVSKSVAGGEFGHSISEEITITGDKTARFAVGAPGNDTVRGYVELMDINTVYSSFQTLYGNLSGDRFGEALAVGDIDGDGDNELVVGAPHADSGVGAVNIYHLVLNLTTQGYEFTFMDVINGSSSDTSFGKFISVGDMNGDTKDDIAVASDQDVYLFHGASTFDVSYDSNFDPLVSFPSSTIEAVSFLGILSGSGGASLGIGLPDTSRGSVLVYHGGASYDTDPDVTFTAPNGVSNFGQDLDVGYDINSDGINDIAIGAPGGGLNRGFTGIYSISSVSSPISSWTSSTTDDGYGYSVAFGTDLRGDGYGDLVVGAPKTSDVGRAWIHERFPLSEVPSNTPVVYIGGAEAWSYSGEHLTEGSVVTTSDLSSAMNSFLSTATPFLYTQYDSYVYLDIQVGMASFKDHDGSNHFKIGDFELLFDMELSTGEMVHIFNTCLDRPDANIDHQLGMVKVPVSYGGSTEGGVRIDGIEVVVDMVPEIESYPGIVHVDEDSHTTDVLDLYLVFIDDLTQDSDLDYQAVNIGENRTRSTSYILDDRYLAVDLPNGTDSANWTGTMEVTLTATDVNGGRSQNLVVLIQVDPVNDPPAITTLPTVQILQDSKLQYLPHAVDDEGDDIYYLLMDAPENMTVDE